MKKRQMEKIAPLRPRKRKYEYRMTVQQADDGTLILDVYKRGEYAGRNIMDPETGEHWQKRAGEKDWKARSFAGLLDIDVTPNGWHSSEDEKRAVIDTKEQEDLLKEALMAKKIHWNPNTFDMIRRSEEKFGRDKRRKTENNRWARVCSKMDRVPPLPEGIHKWIWERHGGLDFAFRAETTGRYVCTACRQEIGEKEMRRADGGAKIRNLDRVVCPKCGREITVKKRANTVESKTHFYIFQKCDDEISVLRSFDAFFRWSASKKTIYIDEAVRILLYQNNQKSRYAAEVYLAQGSPDWIYTNMDGEITGKNVFDNKSNPFGRHTFEGYLYPEGIGEAVKGTAYQNWGQLFAQMAAAGERIHYNKLLISQNDKKLQNLAEYLFKGRFHKLLCETAENVSTWDGVYYGTLNRSGKTIEEVFSIDDRQLINRIREIDGGEDIVKWMRWSGRTGIKIPQETLEWLHDNDIKDRDIKFIEDRMTPQQVKNYVCRQQTAGYKGRTAKGILRQWEDYLGMLKTLKRKADDEMMYKPRDLKRRHDECVEEIRKQRMIEEMKRDKEAARREEKRMRERFPGAEEILREIRPKYEYANDTYRIVVPKRLKEIILDGNALHHCAGSSDRYFDRICQRETYICFLRRTSDPDLPYYTIEVEPGGTIRQHRGMYDEEPEIEEIKPFLREWQKEIRRRMSKEDHDRAAVSARKRQANIEELKAKNNTRVLQGLMEDFMEAEAI